LTGNDPTNQANSIENPETPPPQPAQDTAAAVEGASGIEGASAAEASDAAAGLPEGESRRRILIGSQRDPAAYRPRRRDWIPVEEPESEASAEGAGAGQASPEAPGAKGRPAGRRRPPRERKSPRPPQARQREERPQPAAEQKPAAAESPAAQPAVVQPAVVQPAVAQSVTPQPAAVSVAVEVKREPVGKVPPPNLRERLSPDLEDELNKVLGDAQVDELLGGDSPLSSQAMLEPESRHQAQVVAVRRDDVFVELGGREQGILSVRQFAEPPQPGSTLEVVVQRLNTEEGLYELSLPGAAVGVEDWGDLSEGMLVAAHVTGHNTGGLECEVNHIRGFIPISQVALYRVEDLAPLVGQHFTCLVAEANPERRNLVLSRRAVLEREREEARQQLFNSLRPGQVHEGVVRKLVDFGAFVDLGGVDGLLHISQLAWHRVNHPSEVLAEGQRIKVKIEKIAADTGKISLAYRDLFESPWAAAATKYPPNSVVRGTVTKLMEFGAFVELERGVEGLIHISELAHKRVWRTSDVVKEGDQVEVLVLSVDPQAQRISLSMKALAPAPEPAKKEREEQPAAAAAPRQAPKRKKPEPPLGGGLGRVKGGARFGLKW